MARTPQEQAFDAWWSRDGQYLDPDTSDVPWFDKRGGLAEFAFHAGMAAGRNYVADRSIAPTEFTFLNGRVVQARTDAHGAYLWIGG